MLSMALHYWYILPSFGQISVVTTSDTYVCIILIWRPILYLPKYARLAMVSSTYYCPITLKYANWYINTASIAITDLRNITATTQNTIFRQFITRNTYERVPDNEYEDV